MIHFFSIALRHDFNEDPKIDFNNDLTIILATTNKEFVKNNRIFFRNQLGSIDCYIEDYEAINKQVELLFFWVVCNNVDFYNYTAYPIDVNLAIPYYYWTNSRESNILEEHKFQNIPIETPPKNAVGSIGIKLNNVSLKQQFAITIKVKETIWVYTIYFKQLHKEWIYTITDKNNEWVFTELSKNEDSIVFKSKETIPLFKLSTGRLLLTWINKESNSFKEEQSLVLPFPNYTHKLERKDNQEVSTVYLHL
ncbi:hypothetical protein [Flavobacterium sp.]|uniref:hypothetical protein n=1 Tax=Flavobacterium sp. TaxID=239 RepID=UPI003750C9E2